MLLGTMTNGIAEADGRSHPRVFLSAGEASGDHYGAEIIGGLRSRLPGATFTGLGGRAMEAAGQDRVVRAEDVAHMGLTEVIRHAPYIYSQYRKLVGSIRRERPDVAVLIDFPDVNFRLAKHLRNAGVPVLWFVSPQLWAWKRRRLRWVQQRVDRMLVIFPFEEAFYRARGVKAEFVGHPLAGLEMPTVSREEFVSQYMTGGSAYPERSSHTQRPWVALLPGSRWKEIARNLPTMLQGAASLGLGYDFLIPVANTIDKGRLSDFVFRQTIPALNWPASSVTLVPDAREALYFARASVVASGTATVQALTIGNPFVVVYRVSRLSFAVLKRLVRYPKEIPAEVDEAGNLPVGMVNLIAGKRIVPELLNERFTAENVAAALRPLLEDGPERERMVAELAEARAKLMGEDPIGRVCGAVEELLGR
ncbi:MAG TPA: lipid-A-disaccharide synthase [Acidobacteriaceae bacterium]|jgi:lipid-A-disaccharide synthase|nr:lipid-A-disaccharide synthase [Acidobacteriaceae bacterium]